jgi:hypothetical protein
MISIIEIQTDSPVPNDAPIYYLALRGSEYILEWDTGRAKIMNGRDLAGAHSLDTYDIPVFYYDNAITWEEEDDDYSKDETSIFYNEDFEYDTGSETESD